MAAKKKSTASKKKSSSKKSASKKKSSSARKPADALALLRADHQKVTALFEQFEKTRSEDRKSALAQQICQELTVHAQIEEEIFYPAAREVLRDEDLIDEATVEHQGAKDLIAQIEASGPGEDLFDAKVTVLSEYIKHHVKEEQNELFPKLRKTKLDLKMVGEQLQARKMELMEGGGASAGGSSGSGSRGESGGGSGQGSKTASSGRSSGGGRTKSNGSGSEKRGESEGIMAAMARGIGLAR
jgi:hemerythrin-like domain-containing protein